MKAANSYCVLSSVKEVGCFTWGGQWNMWFQCVLLTGARADKWLAEEVTTHTLHCEVFDLPHFMAPQYSRRIYFLFLWAEFVLLLLEEQQFVGSLFFTKVSLCGAHQLWSSFYSDWSLPEPPITSHLSHLSKVYSVFLCRRFKHRSKISYSRSVIQVSVWNTHLFFVCVDTEQQNKFTVRD